MTGVQSPKSGEDGISIVLLTLGWIAAGFFVKPVGEFPLIDDWVYAASVQSIERTGRMQLSDFSQAFAVPQSWVGWAISKIFGFSFTNLRFLQLFFGWIGLIGTYFLSKQYGATTTVAGLIASSVAFNPLYLTMSLMFMSDIPFFAFSIMSVNSMIRGFKDTKPLWLFIGVFFAELAVSTRQLGLVFTLGFAVAYLAHRKLSLRVVATAIAPLLLGILIHLVLNQWVGSTEKSLASVESQGSQFGKALGRILSGSHPVLKNIILIVQYLGLFSLPISLRWLVDKMSVKEVSTRRRFLIRILLWVSVAAMIVRYKSLTMPSGFHLITPYGIGPMMLKDDFILHTNEVNIPLWLHSVWISVTLLSIIGISLLVERIRLFALENYRQIFFKNGSIPPPRTLFLLVSVSCYIFLISVVTPFYADRYLLICLPMVHLLFLTPEPPIVRTDALRSRFSVPKLSWLIVGAMTTFSVLGARDFLEFNRHRWLALDQLTKIQGVASTRIDGGYEFNGWHLYRPGGARFEDRPRSWWWVTDDEYIVASGPIDGYREVASYPFRRWLLGGRVSRIVVLKRLDASGR